MYERFFGLRERPFDLTPNPRYLFFSGSHREATSTLQYALTGGKGLALLIGEAGTGKTTLIRAALEKVQNGHRCVCLTNPTLKRAEFLEFLATGFGLSPRSADSKTRLLFELEHLLRDERARGVVTALVIDEAQSLSYELLEEVRLLANIETESEKLLPVVLVGQPELAARLNEQALRQLKQRVALRCTLAPLSAQETAGYITQRVRIAGGDGTQIFTRDAVVLIHEHSKGIPRTVSVICDNALLGAYAAGQTRVLRQIVAEVCRDFDLEAASHRPPQPETDGTAEEAARPEAVGESGGVVSAAAPTAPATAGLFRHFRQRRRFSFF